MYKLLFSYTILVFLRNVTHFIATIIIPNTILLSYREHEP